METVQHRIAHRFAEEMILPYNAVDNNLGLRHDNLHVALCADGVEASILEWKEKHFCELEEDIQRIYKMTPWDFLNRWYKTGLVPHSMFFLVFKLKKN